MTLTELRCPRCDAPLGAVEATVTTCRYCGATLHDATATGLVSVHLDDAGPDKIAVVQTVFYELRRGLADARDLVGTAPCVLATDLDRGRANAFVAALTKAGGKARVV